MNAKALMDLVEAYADKARVAEQWRVFMAEHQDDLEVDNELATPLRRMQNEMFTERDTAQAAVKAAIEALPWSTMDK